MEPSLVVRGQDRLWASLLEVVNKGLQAVDSSRDELGTAERLQATAVLQIVRLDQVIDAHCWVAVCHIKPAACREEEIRDNYNILR